MSECSDGWAGYVGNLIDGRMNRYVGSGEINGEMDSWREGKV